MLAGRACPPSLPKEKQMAKPTIVPPDLNEKSQRLDAHTEDSTESLMTTNQGVRINDDQNTLKAGERGPSLLEDFIFREKITHFDHERIPERIVHARGAGAHGYFQPYASMASLTRAQFLQDPAKQTPVFVRFSTVAGSRGSSDLARDVRGFAVKFYTDEGNFDLVGNNIPVFFIQDAMKFPDLIHAVKPEPHNEIPQAQSAHDTFWDFASLMPESTHMLMWVMSDRAIPRSYRMMEGFGVHTFRFVNEKGESHFVKFHWKPLLGVHSVVWDEALQISGQDPDFHRRDLWEAIESGDFPEWELGVQIIPEEDEHKFDFDLLDPTKLVPEEIVPVQRIGKMTLNRNPDNFFAETEQVAFHVGHIVPGIDFTNDPLLQGRLFSYTDTQLIRLGGPNFHEIPINRPLAEIHNNQRDGAMRQQINRGRTSYHPNSLGGGCPMQAGRDMSGFISHAERIDARKIRERSDSFFDHFTQAALFWNSQSDREKQNIVDAFSFELSKCETPAIRSRMVNTLAHVDKILASQVAMNLGLTVPDPLQPVKNEGMPADGDPARYAPLPIRNPVGISLALSMDHAPNKSVKTRKVGLLAADGVDDASIDTLKTMLSAEGAVVKIIAPQAGHITTSAGTSVAVDFALFSASSVLFDALCLLDGSPSVAAFDLHPKARLMLQEAYRHFKPLAAVGNAVTVLQGAIGIAAAGTGSGKVENAKGVVMGEAKQVKEIAKVFMGEIAQHR
ncbi:MAG: catalase, partial [Candidatus Macondimonas sp.]